MNIVHDPIKWSGSMVSSWLRFWIFGAFIVVALAYTVNMAVSFGWRAAMGGVFFLAFFQLGTLYALRRLFLKASGQDNVAGDFDSEKWHFIVMIGIFLAAFFVLIMSFRFLRGA